MKEFKKLSVLILALLMVVFTVACGTDKNKNNADDMANKGNTTAQTTENTTTESSAAANDTDDTGVLDPNDTAGPGTGGNSTVADGTDNPVGDVVDGVAEGVEDVVDGVTDGVDDMTGNDTTNNNTNNNATDTTGNP